MKQRDKMRELFERYPNEDSKIVEAYVRAEQRGEVERKSNRHNLSAALYAKALLKDGRRKRWLSALARTGP